MKKSELRANYKLLRGKLSTKQIDDLSLQIANSVLKLPIWEYSFFHVFLTIHTLKEVFTEPILSILSGKDKNIIVSKTEFEDNAGFLALAEVATPAGLVRLASPETIEDFAHELYSALRAGDDLNLKTIYVVPPTGEGLAQAINDRLNRAAF